MWPKKPTKDMWSNRPAVPIQDRRKHIVPQEDDMNYQVNMRLVKSKVCTGKNCQATICYQKQKKSEYDDFKSQSSMCSAKHSQ